MIRFLILSIMILLVVAGLAWYSAQSLPAWYQLDIAQNDRVAEQLNDQIEQQGLGSFLSGKLADVIRGELVLSETEFNALLLASLNSSEDGRRLLEVSDAVNADLSVDGIELGVIVNLHKVANRDSKSKQAVETILQALPLLDKSRVFIAVKGHPIARDGNLALSDDISLRIGSITLPNSFFRQLGIPVHHASRSSLPLSFMAIKSVKTGQDEIVLGVRPRF